MMLRILSGGCRADTSHNTAKKALQRSHTSSISEKSPTPTLAVAAIY